MFQKSILAALSIFLFWASPGWSTLPQENPGNLPNVMKEFYSLGHFSPFQDLNISKEGGIFFSPESFTEAIKGPSYSDREKQLEMIEKRWARSALDTYYSVRDEEKAKKQYKNNPTMTAKLGGLPRNLHTAVMGWIKWQELLNSQEVLSLPSWCYIVVIKVENNIKSEEEANHFLNKLLPHLLAQNLIHLEVVWNTLDKIGRIPDPSGDCSLVLSGRSLTEAYRKVESARCTRISSLAETIEELYRPVHNATKEYEKLQGTLSHLQKELNEKEGNIRSYIGSNDYLGIMCHGIDSATPKQQKEYALFQESQKEMQYLKKEYKKQKNILFEKESKIADSEKELGKEFFEKVKDMTFSSHILHQEHATQVCEDDLKPEEVTSAANKEADLDCNIFRSKESSPSLKCSIINQEIRKKSALIQQLKGLIEQQEKDLENLINGSCSCLVAANKESEETSPDDQPKLTILNEESI